MVNKDIAMIDALEALLQLQKSIAEVDRSKHQLYMQRFDHIETMIDALLKLQQISLGKK